MNGEGLAAQDNGLPVLSDDTLIYIAEQAEKRVDAVIKIKQVALRVTNANDWVDQNGKPYLMASGSEKIANLFNISWRVNEPSCEEEADGAVTYTYKGEFALAGRSIEAEGSRSSRDDFFKKYFYDSKGNKTGEKPLDRRDLKMAAFTNLLGNGITRLLGIRNLTYDDLEKFAGIKKDQIKGVKYRGSDANKEPPKQPQAKSAKNPDEPASEPQTKAVHAMYKKTGFEEAKLYDYIFEIIGRRIESTKDLTKGEASQVIKKLDTFLNEQG